MLSPARMTIPQVSESNEFKQLQSIIEKNYCQIVTTRQNGRAAIQASGRSFFYIREDVSSIVLMIFGNVKGMMMI